MEEPQPPHTPNETDPLGPTPDKHAPPEEPNASAGSASPSPLPPESLETDNTIVSEGPIVSAENAYSGLSPRDLGKVLVGQQIDSFVLEAFIGGGGMGAVFRGRDLALQRTVAVKVLATHNQAGGDIQRRFEVEAQSAARLDHPNIARIYHVGEELGLQYIVFEYINGVNLRDLVAQHGPQPVKAVLSYAVQIADALAHAWGRNVVHRDIKPSNILVTQEGLAKLVDMGLARLHQAEQAEHELTATGATLGTFDYIAPEQARDPRDADIRSDIYSLGCTLFFLLTGKPPFPDGTALQKLLRHQADQPPDLRAERPDVPRPMARALERMLAKRPESRQQDPDQLVRELYALAEPMGVSASSAAAAALLAAPNRSAGLVGQHAPWVVSVALLLLLVLTAPGWLASPPATESAFEELRPAPPAASPIDDAAALEERGGGAVGGDPPIEAPFP